VNLETYFKMEYAQGKIDFAVRAFVHDGKVQIYIHPHGKSGQTTPTMVVAGNHVAPDPANDNGWWESL
jgi:cobalamin biosynthesis Co2+ chelatase CbiK